MKESTPGFALETLLEVAKETAPEVPEELLRRLIRLQITHQYDDSREIVVQETRRALEEFVAEVSTMGVT